MLISTRAGTTLVALGETVICPTVATCSPFVSTPRRLIANTS